MRFENLIAMGLAALLLGCVREGDAETAVKDRTGLTMVNLFYGELPCRADGMHAFG
jgi:hypothetical protein